MGVTAGAALLGVVLTALPGAAAPESDPAPGALRVWTGAEDSTVGTAIASESCDVTGDGKPDLLTSDWLWERAPYGQIGAVYVIPNGTPSGDLDDPTTGITRIEGLQREDVSVGFRLNCAGDVNGDGFDDVLIDEGDSSRVWVVFGSPAPQNLSLEFLGDRGFAIDRAEDLDGGVDVSSAGVGDLDGDGYDDIAVVSPRAHDKAGQVTVVKGRDDIATVHSEDDAEVLMRIDGGAGHGLTRVQRAGDVDGDGIDDIIVGAPDARTDTLDKKSTGMAWAVSGASRGTVDLTGDFDGFAIEGPAAGKNRLGMALVGAGDVDGDGFDDLLIGAPGTGVAGGAAVVRGSDSHDTVYTDPTAANGHAVWTGEAPVLEEPTPEATEAVGASAPAEQTEAASEVPDTAPAAEPAETAEAAEAGEASTDRGWWIADSETGTANNMAFTVAADESRDDHVGTLVIGLFIKNRVVALPATVLGDAPVIDLAEVPADGKLVLEQPRTFLGRAMGIVDDFGEDTCPLVALGGRGADLEGDVQLHALPGADAESCASETSPAPTPTLTDEPDPTAEPTTEPTREPTPGPTDGPTEGPSSEPSDEPTGDPSVDPTGEPSHTPTEDPDRPTDGPGADESDADADADADGDRGDGDGGGGLADEGADEDGPSTDEDDSAKDDALPRTGVSVAASLAAGLALVVLGATLIIRARRKTA